MLLPEYVGLCSNLGSIVHIQGLPRLTDFAGRYIQRGSPSDLAVLRFIISFNAVLALGNESANQCILHR